MMDRLSFNSCMIASFVTSKSTRFSCPYSLLSQTLQSVLSRLSIETHHVTSPDYIRCVYRHESIASAHNILHPSFTWNSSLRVLATDDVWYSEFTNDVIQADKATPWSLHVICCYVIEYLQRIISIKCKSSNATCSRCKFSDTNFRRSFPAGVIICSCKVLECQLLGATKRHALTSNYCCTVPVYFYRETALSLPPSVRRTTQSDRSINSWVWTRRNLRASRVKPILVHDDQHASVTLEPHKQIVLHLTSFWFCESSTPVACSHKRYCHFCSLMITAHSNSCSSCTLRYMSNCDVSHSHSTSLSPDPISGQSMHENTSNYPVLTTWLLLMPHIRTFTNASMSIAAANIADSSVVSSQ